jgi:type VI secretion system secreted protein VgrG
MGSSFAQTYRLLRLATPLGPDKLLLRSFTGREAISELFSFQLDLLSEDSTINFDDLVGQNVTFAITLADGETYRYFNGFISRFAQLPGIGRLARYQAEVVPGLWFLTRTTDCRIYQNLSVPEIIKDVLERHNIRDVDFQLQASYPKREYCVQYRETSYNFIQRLMEQEGIFYYFRHEDGKHTLVLGDAPAANPPCPNQKRARYEPAAGPGFAAPEDYVTRWKLQHELRPGRCTVTDFNFETPTTSLLTSLESKIQQGGNTSLEVYDFPGEYLRRDEGEREVRLRVEREEAAHAVVQGASVCRAFTPGYRFEFYDHERKDQNGMYLITSVTHNATEGGFYSGVGGPQEASYDNLFTAIPYSVPFRPPRITPKPVVHGAQTAIVVGPSGEEIYTDKYGRVKVQFHWDRLGKYNEKSSCWIRVSQPWAGKGWGGIWIPRIGQEVIVDFLEGDPDRPIITGRVYNANQMPPYELPAEQTKSGFKSRSSKGGSTQNFNEIRFEDKKGAEEIVIHAERDLTTTVENNETRTVYGKRTTAIKKDETLTISEGNRKETLEQGNDTLELWQGNRDVTLMKGSDSLVVQMGNITIKAPAGTHSTTALQIEITGMTSVKVVCGASSIQMTPGTIDITSPVVTIKGGMVKINC